MQPLSAILDACSVAMQRMTAEPDCDWHTRYCAVVDPVSVLEMAIVIKSLIEYIDTRDSENTVTERVKARIGDKPGPYAGQSKEVMNK